MDGTTAWQAVTGGALIGVAASGLLLLTGRVAGVSGIAAGLLRRPDAETAWRLAFVLGLLAGGVVLRVVMPAAFQRPPSPSFALLAVAGLLVGGGTRLASGCTSGHGVCGLSRRSPRSLAATLTFIASGVVTVLVARHLWGIA